MDKFYALEINKLLRTQLKFRKMAEFERLASYAVLWGVANEQTYLYLALSQLRLGVEQKPNRFYMTKLTDVDRKRRLEAHVKSAIKDLDPGDRHQFRELMDSSSQIYFNNEEDDEEKLPSNRAKLLCTLNPATFRHQNIDGKLDRIVQRQYQGALEDYKKQKINHLNQL